LSLLLGKEFFDINQTINASGAHPRQSFGGSQSSPGTPASSQTPTAGRSQGLTYLVAQHKLSQVLQAEAVITGSMTLQPAGMQSETHRMLVRAVGQKHHKVARLRMAPDPKMDPEREKQELMKVSAKKARKKAEEYGFGRRRRSAYSKRRAGHDMWSDDEDEGREFAASDEDTERGPDGTPKKRRRSFDEGTKDGEYQEDDFLVADSPDGEKGDGGEGKGARGREDEVEEDPLDRLDEQIQRQADERRRQRERGLGAQEEQKTEAEEEMDVESEEDEDDFRVRRTGTSSRKKRAIDFEEEDDE